MDRNAMTLEQKMTLKAILEGDYNITSIHFRFVADTNYLSIDVDGKHARILPDGKITMTQQVEVEL